MDKNILLDEIKNASQQNLVSRDEVISAFDAGRPSADYSSHKKLSVTDILYYIGGGIVFLGISILVSQNWQTLSAAVQILVTLGGAVAAYIVGVLFNRYPNLKGPAVAFFLISALLMPVGIYVTLNKAGVDINSAGTAVFVSALLLAIFLASFYVFNKSIFTLFAIVYATALFFALVQWVMGSSPYFLQYKIPGYEFLAVGLVYMLLGFYFTATSEAKLSGVLYAFGSLSFLGSALALGGWRSQSVVDIIWELVYPLLIFAIIVLSVKIKSKSFLVFGSLFLIAYISKITGEYFSTGLGWPLALVLMGLVIIAVSYYAVRIGKRYFSTSTQTSPVHDNN